MCLFTFVAFRVTFDGLCCWMQLCGLLSLLPLKVASQSWHTGPNETVLHFQVVFVISWHQIGELVLVIFWTFSLILHKIRKTWSSSLCEYIETNIPVERLTLHVFVWYFHQIVGKSLFECFIYMFVSIYCILCHFQRFMVLNATLWLTVTHTFKGNRRKLAHWSKWICITVGSCFCSLLTWNWEVSTGRFLCSFTNFAQITQNFILSSYIEDIETNLPFEKHILRVFTW